MLSKLQESAADTHRIEISADMSEQKENLFPTMGEIATRTDALKDVEDDDARLNERAGALIDQEEGEERGMQEMDSLCMRCHEQVSSLLWTHEYLSLYSCRVSPDCF